ncbi:hypothetical protein EDB19DRAFT_1921217 [Suillus lakei]|nr:hypothetical protein EDB19DRAFT_1921217 [Suillus lakei]
MNNGVIAESRMYEELISRGGDFAHFHLEFGGHRSGRSGNGHITSIGDWSKFVYADDQLGAAKQKKTKRIMRELRICDNLKHANILPVHGYTYGFGTFIAIVSPWAENGNLTDYLEREGAALALVRRFQIASPSLYFIKTTD